MLSGKNLCILLKEQARGVQPSKKETTPNQIVLLYLLTYTVFHSFSLFISAVHYTPCDRKCCICRCRSVPLRA